MPEITREGLQIARSLMRRGIRKVKWTTISKPKDEFGRGYVAHLDRANLHPIGLIERLFPENIPVPDKYLSIPPDQTWLMHIDFDQWYAEAASAEEDWHRRLREAMVRVHGNEGHTRTERSVEAERQTGPKPMPKELVALMAAGDKWCLGFQQEPTEAVKAVIGDDREMYVRYVLRQVRGSSGASREGDGKLKLPKAIAALVRKDRVVRQRQDAPPRAVRPDLAAAEDEDAPINPEG